MGRYVTPRGVEVEVSDEAARVVGYKPVAEKSASPKPAAKKTAAKKSSSAKSDK